MVAAMAAAGLVGAVGAAETAVKEKAAGGDSEEAGCVAGAADWAVGYSAIAPEHQTSAAAGPSTSEKTPAAVEPDTVRCRHSVVPASAAVCHTAASTLQASTAPGVPAAWRGWRGRAPRAGDAQARTAVRDGRGGVECAPAHAAAGAHPPPARPPARCLYRLETGRAHLVSKGSFRQTRGAAPAHMRTRSPPKRRRGHAMQNSWCPLATLLLASLPTGGGSGCTLLTCTRRSSSSRLSIVGGSGGAGSSTSTAPSQAWVPAS